MIAAGNRNEGLLLRVRRATHPQLRDRAPAAKAGALFHVETLCLSDLREYLRSRRAILSEIVAKGSSRLNRGAF
jgi:hypothetical protein